MQLSPSAATATEPAELTTDELAARLKKCVATIREYARKGYFPGAYRCGRDWRFPPNVRYTPPQPKPAADDAATAGPSPLDALRAWRDA
ncbi:MAG: helix-turn-helix domain-containing protein [Gemmatimonadota bacterium]|nr:helix-turn-helix domain-containing protein [Gemmatimonadota bacterium]MDE3174223.1 helix-turn-helix domain-containing protein [Gemmatimonadota bacterium]